MSAFREIPAFARDLPRFEDHARQHTEHTTCYMCACRCGIQVTLEDDKLRFLQGTPGHPVNDGVICAKGSAGIMKQESPVILLLGIGLERWLFLIEGQHMVNLYHGRAQT